MRTLIYKRTHIGDPDEAGRFGCNCCMASVRSWDFAAVIGIGGIGQEATSQNIDRKITWIGLHPKEIGTCDCGYPVLAFEKFYLKDAAGRLLAEKAPELADRLFSENAPRRLLIDSSESTEVRAILLLAKNSQPSPTLIGKKAKQTPWKCKPQRKKKC